MILVNSEPESLAASLGTFIQKVNARMMASPRPFISESTTLPKVESQALSFTAVAAWSGCEAALPALQAADAASPRLKPGSPTPSRVSCISLHVSSKPYVCP
ncbi:hypothetical protein NG2371_06837 [Nocardia gamkensis]|nr:hypothetical protein [Nocardia gamkensis]